MASSIPESAVSEEPTTVEKLRGLRWSYLSNISNTLFVQYTFFGSIFILFLNELGLSKGEVGFVLSLLPFSGLISIFVAPAVERFGYKRTYITFWSGRSLISIFLLLTPWILSAYGRDLTLVFMSTTVAIFALLRSVGMTANLPWVQEFVPDSVRGKYTATSNMLTSLAGFIAISLGGYVLAVISGLPGYMLLISVGVVAGFASVWFAAFIPGGAPRSGTDRPPRNLGTALKDATFRRYLLGVGLLTLASVPATSFVPLFMQEQVGLDTSNVVLLQIGALAGSLISSYLWGWAADRYGSKPVMLWGLGLRLIVPIVYILMPRAGESVLWIALSVSLLRGIADMGWGIGSARMLYVSIVPSAKRSDYMALYNAWIGITGGISQLVGGYILQASAGITGVLGAQIFFLSVDPYLPLFLIAFVLTLLTGFVLNRIQADESLGMGAFAGIFFRGNPFLAMTSMVRFHLAQSESATVVMTERLASARSPLAVEELLEAIEDPRFNVRIEAVISIARMPADPRLVEGLIKVFEGSELALSAVSAWALGRMGDPAAYPALRRGLDSEYRSLRAHAARALGALGIQDATPELLASLQTEEDKGLQMAYASALGNLKAKQATPRLLQLLKSTGNEGARIELALSIARIVGDEHRFIQLLRSTRSDPGTSLAQAMVEIRRSLGSSTGPSKELAADIDEIANHFARNRLDEGARSLAELLAKWPAERYEEEIRAVLTSCESQIREVGLERVEYALLAIHLLRRSE